MSDTHPQHDPASPPVDEAAAMYPAGTVLAGYRIEQVLACGATGTVYLAQNPTLPRRDALKVLNADLSQNPSIRQRFVHEAEIASQLDHPNIVSIYARGQAEDGQLWIAMQYVAGTDAEQALQNASMTPARAVRIISEVAKALDYAHQRGVVHHDVKPGNILLANASSDDEHVLLSDFGVARAAGTTGETATADGGSTLAVTLAYAAPEVITGAAVDGRADIYSLGCTLFRLLTGSQPYSNADGPAAVAQAHLRQPPPRISEYLPAATRQLDVVVARALAKVPSERYGSAREFAAAAAAAAASLLTPAAAPTHRPRDVSRKILGGNTIQRIPGRLTEAGRNATAQAGELARRRPVSLLWAIFALVATIAAALWAALLWPTEDAPKATPATSTASPTTSTTLNALIPPGYPPGTCVAIQPGPGQTAAVACGRNVDPGGPTAATYALAADQSGLTSALNDVIKQSTPVICPPNIQSPGPWRRNTNPAVNQGTVFCGLQEGQPVVAWTTDTPLLLSVAHAHPTGPTLDALYAWWSSHS